MKKRVYGLETEYGIIDLNDDVTAGVGALTPFFDIIFEKVRGLDNHPIRFFYLNGAYIYLENTGYHPEYATPECASIRDLVKWDKAGERIFEETLLTLNRALIDNGRIDSQLRLFKNNIDADGTATFGCHENYLVSRAVDDDHLSRNLIPFLVSRQIFCGSGCVEETGFRISQRSSFIAHDTNSSSTSDRPIVGLKDDAMAAREDWRRLHLILGDANMSQISAFLKVGTAALVLQMIEDGFFSRDRRLKLYDAVSALKEISADPDCRIKVALSKPETCLSAVEIQGIYLDWAKEYLAGSACVGREWREIVQRWEAVIEALKENPMKLYRQVDWVAKKWLMESVLKKRGSSWADFRKNIGSPENQRLLAALKTIDLQYHDIRRDIGLYYLLEKEGIAEILVGEEEIEQAKIEPPRDTRANWRAGFLKMLDDERFKKIRIQLTEWENVTMSFRANASAACYEQEIFSRDDPRDGRPPDVDAIFRKLSAKMQPD